MRHTYVTVKAHRRRTKYKTAPKKWRKVRSYLRRAVKR